MEKMHIDRVDFTEARRCGFCDRPLPLGIAHIVRMDDQTEIAAGPVCARKNAPTEDYPNFTTAAYYTDEQIEPSDGHRAGRRLKEDTSERRAETERHRAVTYLRLRQEKMSDFPNVRHSVLDPIYERFCSGGLTNDDVAHLGRLMAVVEQRYPLLALNALKTAYSYHKLILRAAEKIEHEEKRQYLLSLDEYLRANLRLTPAQIDGANRWLEHLGQVRLRQCSCWKAALRSAVVSRHPAPVYKKPASRNEYTPRA